MAVIYTILYIALGMAGIAVCAELIHHRKKHSGHPLMCPMNHDCSVVTDSKYSTLFGMKNDVLGMVFYCLALVLGLGALSLPIPVWVLLAYAVVGLLASIVFVGIQIFLIKDYCFYCLSSALITVLLVVVALLM